MGCNSFPNRLVVLAALMATCCMLVGCGHEPVGVVLTYQVRSNAAGRVRPVDIEKLPSAINQRLGRAGKAKALSDGLIEVSVYGNVDATELEYIKRRISLPGVLEFRITADPMHAKDRPIIEQAKLLPPDEKEFMLGGKKAAEWVEYSEAEFGPVDVKIGGLVKRQAGAAPEALVLMDPMNVTSDFLTSASKGLDERGGPAIHFSFSREGARRFRLLTSQNKPNPATPDVHRRIGIILDKELISAPEIRETISDRGMISGGSMTEREVDMSVAILSAGSLPVPIELVKERRVLK